MFKSVSLALVAIAASATLASAATNNISPFVENQNGGNRVELGTVTASGDGIVEVYSYRAGEAVLLGTTDVMGGANNTVLVRIPDAEVPHANEGFALLKVDGQIVDQQALDFQ